MKKRPENFSVNHSKFVNVQNKLRASVALIKEN